LVADEAVEHPLLRDHGEVAVGAAVERAGTAVVRAAALELDVLPDDPHDVRRVADLLDDVVGNQAHAVNSAIVTPWPPCSRGAKPKRSTRGSRARRSCTNWRRAPVPLPWMMRRYGRSARMASSRALISTASASSTLSPRSETSVVAVVLVGDRSPPRGGRAGLGARRGAAADSPLRRRSSSGIHPFPFPPTVRESFRVPPSPAFSRAFSPASSPAVCSIAFSTSRRASFA